VPRRCANLDPRRRLYGMGGAGMAAAGMDLLWT
jgi:hypothetical protein